MTPTVPPRRAWIVLAITWIAALAGLVVWLLGTSNDLLREQLKSTQFWSLEASVFLAVAIGAALARDLVRGLERRDLIRIAGLVALAAALTLFVAPRTNRIYFDEQIYQSVGQNLSDLKRAQVCNDGAVEYGRLHCAIGEYNKQPYGYPHVLSLAYRVAGVRPSTPFALNAAVMALTVGAVYLLVWLLFRDRDASFFAGLLVALTPQQILWSATAAVEPSASFALVAALVFVAHASQSARPLALAGAAVAVAYAVQFRPESLLIVPVAAMLLWRRIRDEIATPRLWWIGLLFLALVAVHLAHTYAVRNVEWGTSDERMSLRYVASNLRVNGGFFLGDGRFPVVFTVLALAGLAGAASRAAGLAVATYFLLFFGICLVFYAGSYNYGADVRYSLMVVPPVAMLGGLGAARLAGWLDRVTRRSAGGAVLAFALIFHFLWYAPLVRATTEEAWAARADVRFAQNFVSELPRSAYVLTHNPGMFHVWGANAGQMSLAVGNQAYLDFLASRYTGGLYLHWNFWCNVRDPVQPEFCRKALQAGSFEMVREYRERDQRFAFYRLH